MMIPYGKRRQSRNRFTHSAVLLFAMLASLLALGFARASVPVPSEFPYEQDFDSLISSGSAVWTDNVTLEGWYAAGAGTSSFATYTAFDSTATGTNFDGGLYSFGTDASDRALGLIGSSSGNPKRFGVVLKNTSTVPIKSFTISYTGEQWLSANTGTQTLQFKYARGTSLGADTLINDTGLSAEQPALSFTSPNTTGSGPVDGNAAGNRTAVGPFVLNFSPDLAANEEAMLVWELDNVSGDDHGLAVDDLSVQATITAAVGPKATCPATATAFRGTTTDIPVSAFDPNDTVTSATIQSVSPPPTLGTIDLANETPATAPGGTYTADLQVSGLLAVGTYDVTIRFTSEETNETVDCTVAVNVENAATDLAVSKDGPADYRPGENLTYLITVNPGGLVATNVVLTDTLPAGLTYVSDNSGVTPTQNGQQLVWNLGNLTSQRVVSLVARVGAGVTGTIVNTATASTGSPDGNQDNNTDSASSTFRVLPASFDGSTKTASATTVQVGTVFTYTLTITNSGEVAGSYTLTDTIPAQLSIVSAPGMTVNGQTLTASGTVSAGGQATYMIAVRAESVGVVTNTATLAGANQTLTLTAPAVTIQEEPVTMSVYLPLIYKNVTFR